MQEFEYTLSGRRYINVPQAPEEMLHISHKGNSNQHHKEVPF
jgi:hypothetical protein